jgi:hypothetical protein
MLPTTYEPPQDCNEPRVTSCTCLEVVYDASNADVATERQKNRDFVLLNRGNLRFQQSCSGFRHLRFEANGLKIYDFVRGRLGHPHFPEA